MDLFEFNRDGKGRPGSKAVAYAREHRGLSGVTTIGLPGMFVLAYHRRKRVVRRGSWLRRERVGSSEDRSFTYVQV